MDDRSFFGDILYNLKFSDAINNKPALLTDYKLIVIGVDDEMIHQQIENRNLISLKDGTIVDSENLASHIALAKTIEKYDLSSVITFHSKVKSAKLRMSLTSNSLAPSNTGVAIGTPLRRFCACWIIA